MNKKKSVKSPLLAVGAVHHHLIEKRLRMKVALLVETGEAREVHHLCVLLGFGADAICPYLLFETIRNLNERALLNTTFDNDKIFHNYTQAVSLAYTSIRDVMMSNLSIMVYTFFLLTSKEIMSFLEKLSINRSKNLKIEILECN
jgi:Glutamate synthase central domain